MDTATLKPSLTIKKRFNKPPARIYAAWTKPEELAKWMGGSGTIACKAEADVRVGGRYHIMMKMADDEHNVGGVYREVVPNEKLVFTWAWRSTPDRESLVTITFKADGDGTIMTFNHSQFFDEAARDKHNTGWGVCFEKLQNYLSGKTQEQIMTEPHGKFVWNELNTHDLAGAKKFLSTTLGWSFDAMPIPDGTYWIAKKGEERIGGLFDMSGDAHCKSVPEHWLSYIAVDDIDARYKKALAAGAKEGRAPFDIPNVGRIAILQQPGGAMVGWITPKPM